MSIAINGKARGFRGHPQYSEWAGSVKAEAHRFVAVRGSDGWRSELALIRRHSSSQHVCTDETSAMGRTTRELVVGQATS